MSEAGEKPQPILRPALPRYLLPVGAIWLAEILVERSAWQGWPAWLGLLVAAALAGVLIVVIRLVARYQAAVQTLRICLAAVLLALLSASLFWYAPAMDSTSISTAGNPLFEVEILDDANQGQYSQTSTARLSLNGQQWTVRVLWQTGQSPLPLGAVTQSTVSIIPLKEHQRFLHERGICASVKLTNCQSWEFPQTIFGGIAAFREKNRQLIAGIGGSGSALLRGVLLGDCTALDDSGVNQSFRICGLSHLIAVSGSHLVLIAALASWLLERLGLGIRVNLLLIAVLLVAYVLLTACQPSAIRACAMTLAANTARLVGRRNHTPSALSLVACIMLLAWPPTAASIGFWLSVFAVFGLTVFCPLITAHLICLFTGRSQSGPGRKWLGRVFEPAGLTVTAQLFTLPLTAPLFATISLISPLANLLAAPLVTLMVGGGIVAACLVPLCSDLSLVVFRLLCLVGQAAAQLSEWLSGIPYASWPVAVDMVPTLLLFLLLAALLYLLWPQPGPRPRLGLALMLVAAVCANVLCLNLPTGAQLIVMDVGQGDALIIRDGRNCVLIDTGPDEKALLRALARNNISHIDAVVLTHLDLDHCGALSALRGTIPTEDVFFAADLLTYQADDAAVSAAAWLDADGASELASQDQLLVSGQLTLTVVWPAEPVREGGNDQSLCLRLSYDCNLDGQPETQALLTGDAELPELRLILADDPQTYQVLKVGHHGSNDAIGLEELQLMRTEIALICVGADNYYGHPTAQTLTTLEAADVALFRTDLHGDITLDFGPTAIQVSYDSIAPELTSR